MGAPPAPQGLSLSECSTASSREALRQAHPGLVCIPHVLTSVGMMIACLTDRKDQGKRCGHLV